MAENQDNPNSTSSVEVSPFISGMIRDVDDTYSPEGSWSYARNATKVTANGNLNTLSNEPSNLSCIATIYTIIGTIHLTEDIWAIFSTNNTVSEIGLFDDSQCKYNTLATDPCTATCAAPAVLVGNNTTTLGFNTANLISGAAKQDFDCLYSVYFADGKNPDRYVKIDIDAIKIADEQFVQCQTLVNDCYFNTPTCKIDCDQIRLSSLMSSPCVTVTGAVSSGSLLNGSYFATIAYTINEQVVSSYFPISNVQPVFSHNNLGGAITLSFTGLDTVHFTEFELVLIRVANQQTSAKRMGIYSTHTTSLLIDNINETLTNIPLEVIPIVNPVPEKSDAIYEIGDYLIRSGPTNRFDFNYQPLANRIRTKWQSIEYPSDYYRKGGNRTTYLRDEIYPFFIRWVYDTGDRSSAYHLPGRAPRLYNFPGGTPNLNETGIAPFNIVPGNLQPLVDKVFEVYNTASTDTVFTPFNLPDGGRVIAQGDMGYWESTETYPDNKPLMWNLSSWNTVTNPWPDSDPASMPTDVNGDPIYDLCGHAIRHHKFPENLSNPAVEHITPGATNIRLLGVHFDNIALPLDNDGNPIPGIVGYEILRGSREGNKTVIAKGILNNIRAYVIPGSNTFGLYQNYPYNFQGDDNTLVQGQSHGGWSILNQPASLGPQFVQQDKFTFHSPDTSFKHPFLAVNELKTYGELTADILGNFTDVPDHPKEKLITDLAFIIAALMGVAEAALAIRGQQRTQRAQPNPPNYSIGEYLDQAAGWTIAGTSTGTTLPFPIRPNWPDTFGLAMPASFVAFTTYQTALLLYNDLRNNPGNLIIYAPTGTSLADINFQVAYTAAEIFPGGMGFSDNVIETDAPKISYLDPITRAIVGIPVLTTYWSIGTDTTLRLIYALVPYEQYAYCYQSHGFYNNFSVGNLATQRRRYSIPEINYLSNSRQTFNNQVINNLYRSECVALRTNVAVSPLTIPIINGVPTPDNSLVTIPDSPGGYSDPDQSFTTHSTSYYAAIIQRIKSQYGQLDSIQQLPISCVYLVDPNLTNQTTDTIFGGDTYVSRYTEKNTFFYFYDWLQSQPDGYEYDYRLRYMLTYPRFWADFTHFEAGDFMSNVFSGGLQIPNDKAALDRTIVPTNFLGFLTGIRFRIKEAYFYLFQSGVRDFFVESEVNTDLRDWGELPEERFYDPYRYTSLTELFAPKIIKDGNYYKYDYSLSISKLYTNFISWGSLQLRSYDPFVADTCYVHLDKRLLYSLPQNKENRKDYWRVFLANNYKDFYSTVSGIKAYNANGAVILFDNDSPTLWKGVDTLETDIGTKITIGDGGLFAQPAQSVVNVDISYEYGSCQDKLSVVNTPFGLYYMSASQGKIFHLTDHLDDITYQGLKFWFREYLPYKLLVDFPDFNILANPVAGIGCQSIYDNQIETLYFCKRDWTLRPEFAGPNNPLIYDTETKEFKFGQTVVKLGDPLYFQDASWTVSYDPKSKEGGWISYHDWHPDLNIPSRTNFLTIIHDPLSISGASSIWRHNARRDDFCKFYDIYYPFEVEYIGSTKLSVNTLRSIEYYMECFRYTTPQLDRFHLLDWNFDEAVVYNSEQVSGRLKLNLQSTNDPFGNLAFPNVTLQPAINVLYNKVEQKYRVNQFWDITNDRGEFTPSQQVIWNTDPNGYTRNLNINNLDYNKVQTQRKKFRHYTNRILLTKQPPVPLGINPVNMVVKAVVDKNLLSMR